MPWYIWAALGVLALILSFVVAIILVPILFGKWGE